MAEENFRYYHGRQRVGEAMANMLINASKRYNKKRRKRTKMMIALSIYDGKGLPEIYKPEKK
jgi:hypothetical protein